MDFQTGFKVGDKRILLREYRSQGRIYGMDLFSLGEIEIERTRASMPDKRIQWLLPLAADRKWLIRPEGETDLDLEKEWVGKETLAFEGKDYACDVFILHSIVPLKSWIDSLGQAVDTSTVDLERYELLKLNPTPAEIAAAKAKYQPMSTMHIPPSNPGS